MTLVSCEVCGKTLPYGPSLGVVTEIKVVHNKNGTHEVEISERLP